MNKLTLKDCCKFQEGYVNPSQTNKEYFDGDIKWLRGTDLNNSYVSNTSRTLTQKGYKSAGKSAYLFKPNSLVISKSGTIGTLGILKDFMCGNRAVINIEVDTNKVPLMYIFFLLLYKKEELKAKAVGSIQKNLYVSTLETLELCHSKEEEMKKIAELFTLIQNKIELNNKINQELETLAKTIYDYWFLQFEFPNEEGKPYKSSGGEMIYNEQLKREIPKGWEIKLIKDLLEVKTGKEDANFATSNGKYNFFTCSNEILKCDIPKFKGKSILIAGNGDFNVKFYNGEFNAYQRTYVLTPNEEKYFGLIYQNVIRNISHLKNNSTGSIIKFITKSDVENIQVVIPNDGNLILKFNTYLDEIIHNKNENQELIELRDWLLPLLMNGQVTFKEDK